MLEPQNWTISLNNSTTLKAWKEKYINTYGHATNVKLWTYKPHFIDLHQHCTNSTRPHIHISLSDHTKSLHQVTLMLWLQYVTLQVTSWPPLSKTNGHLFSDNMLKIGFPRILLSDNGMEFKSKLIKDLSQQLGIRKTLISLGHPQANGKLEFSLKFIKECIWKFSVDGVLEWDQLLPYATAAFNCFPNEHSKESPSFIYLRYEPYLPFLAAFYIPN